jgi:NlpC/P60 family putative phage cell wall peptidase
MSTKAGLQTGSDPQGLTPTRADVVRLARGWIGTPYHHQASTLGVGADCLGLVRGVWRQLYGCDAEGPPAYSRDWAEARGRETLLEAARRHLVEIVPAAASSGDVVVFRLRPAAVAKHAAILASARTMIHAMEGGPAAEVVLSPWWRRRIAGAFRFPGLADKGPDPAGCMRPPIATSSGCHPGPCAQDPSCRELRTIGAGGEHPASSEARHLLSAGSSGQARG